VEQRSEILGRFRVNSTPKKTKGKKIRKKKKKTIGLFGRQSERDQLPTVGKSPLPHTENDDGKRGKQ
jgi:hypothetical protein